MIRSILALLSCVSALVSQPLHAEDKVWSAVLIATNVSSPNELPAELKPIAGRLKRVFGYNQFEIVGTDQAELTDGVERQLKPTKTFWLTLTARHASIKEARGG